MINFTLYVSIQTSELFQNILWRDPLDFTTGKNVINSIFAKCMKCISRCVVDLGNTSVWFDFFKQVKLYELIVSLHNQGNSLCQFFFHLSPESPPQYHGLCPDSSEVHIE